MINPNVAHQKTDLVYGVKCFLLETLVMKPRCNKSKNIVSESMYHYLECTYFEYIIFNVILK